MNRIRQINVLKAAVFALMVAKYVKNRRNRIYKKPRCWWVRPWLNRKDKGNLHLVHEEFREDQDQFKHFLRMDENVFNKLLNIIQPAITKQETLMRSSITAKEKLTVTLRFLATGETYRSLMYSFRISESTISLFIPEVCRAIYDGLKGTYMQVPSTAAEWLNIAQEFNDMWNLPNTIGALDGKHIVFRAPRSSGSMYYNYKNQNSIVLLALVDAQYRFRYVDVGTNGRVSDGGVFQQSSLCGAIKNNDLNIPEDKALPGRNLPMPHIIVADAAFPLSEHILKPYPFRNMTHSQRIFNYRLSRARRVVENAFGIMANRFRIFLTTINLSPNKVQDITLACCALHNYLRTESINYFRENEEVDQKSIFKYGLAKQGANRSKDMVRRIREEFMEYVNNEGAVSWQEDI